MWFGKTCRQADVCHGAWPPVMIKLQLLNKDVRLERLTHALKSSVVLFLVKFCTLNRCSQFEGQHVQWQSSVSFIHFHLSWVVHIATIYPLQVTYTEGPAFTSRSFLKLSRLLPSFSDNSPLLIPPPEMDASFCFSLLSIVPHLQSICY